jgi:hypothetical protein
VGRYAPTSETNRWREAGKLIAIQSAIDALDKAYQDEKADMVG